MIRLTERKGDRRKQVMLDSMDKRISKFVVGGFLLQLVLGICAGLLLNHSLNQIIHESTEYAKRVGQTGLSIHRVYLEDDALGQELSNVLLLSKPVSSLDEIWQESRVHYSNIYMYISQALAATRNAELKATLNELLDYKKQALYPLEEELLRLARKDPAAARAFYLQRYIPASNKNIQMLDSVWDSANREAGALVINANQHASLEQKIAMAIIILLFTSGILGAILLSRHVNKLMRISTDAAHESINMMDYSLDVICSIDEDGRFSKINGACKDIWGYPSEELEGNRLVDLVHPEDVDRTRQAWAKAKSGDGLRAFHNRCIRRDSSLVQLMWTIHWSDEKRHFFCIARDVTESMNAEYALRLGEERMRLVIATAQDAFVGIDATSTVTDWNPQAEQTFGWSREEAIGQSLPTLIMPVHLRELHRRGMERFLATSEGPIVNRRIELPALHRDGGELLVEITISPIQVSGGYIFSAFLRDITQRKRAENELREAKETAEAATRTKSKFLANMSHEIRTPMNGVISLTKLVLKTHLSYQQREYLTLIQNSANSLLRILNDVLDFSKMEADKLELDITRFDFRESVGISLKTLSTLANEKKLELICQISPAIPSILLGDAGRLGQIIINLTANALKFTKQGEVLVRVDQELLTDTETMLHFCISDTGIGISKEQQQYIFNAFAQADSSTTRNYGGTGLGLAIVAKLIHLKNGTFWIESESNAGTNFHFKLKFDIPPQEDSQLAAQKMAGLKNASVLLIDDNQTLRNVLKELLESWGLHPILAKNAKEAITKLEINLTLSHPLKVVLLDSEIPNFDIDAFVQTIKSRPDLADIAIIMFCSSKIANDAKWLTGLGVAGILQKPIMPQELQALLLKASSTQSSNNYPASLDAVDIDLRPARKLHVLVAEDHPTNQVLMMAILEARDHTYAIANNGIEVLNLLEQQSFDLILMDGQMPEMDGYLATAEIRRREQATGKHIHIIAITANAMKGDREACLATGMDDYIAKPVDLELLINRIESWDDAQATIQTDTPNSGTVGSSTVLPGKTLDLEPTLKISQGKLEVVIKMAYLFLEDLPKVLDDIDAALTGRDALRILRAAHRLGGAAAILSAESLTSAAKRLELLGRNSEFAQMPAAIDEIKQHAFALAAELEEMITSHQA